MIFFFLVLKVLTYFLKFFLFFKNKNNNLNGDGLNNSDHINSLNMLQCEKCKIYLPKDDGLYHKGKFFCKKEHIID